MAQADLIPIYDHQRAVEIGRKGGLAKTQAKKIAQQLSAARKKNTNLSNILLLAQEPNPDKAYAKVLELMSMQEKILSETKNNKVKFHMGRYLAQQYLEFIKAKYGEKHKNININFNEHLEAWREARLKIIKEELEELRTLKEEHTYSKSHQEIV